MIANLPLEYSAAYQLPRKDAVVGFVGLHKQIALSVAWQTCFEEETCDL